jgi:hypothetical protein
VVVVAVQKAAVSLDRFALVGLDRCTVSSPPRETSHRIRPALASSTPSSTTTWPVLGEQWPERSSASHIVSAGVFAEVGGADPSTTVA